MKRPRKVLWFRAKTYGWGWTPVTWQGWLLTLVFALLYVVLVLTYMSWLGVATLAHAANYRGLALGTLEFLGAGSLLSYALIRVCSRYGEKPSWRWGKK